MKTRLNYLAKLRSLIGLFFGIVVLLLATHAQSHDKTDSLYIGDVANDTVQRFNARTGEYLGQFVTPGRAGLNGPRGMIFTQGRLLLVNQNVDQDFAGEILGFQRDTGAFLNAVVPCNPPQGRACDPNAPFAPRGMIRGHGNTLYVADHEGGRVARYHLDSGTFLGNLDTGGFDRPFFPRGIVRGPDDLLYVSVTNLLNGDGFTGYVVRFNAKTGRFVDIFTSNEAEGCARHLHRPEGLVFGPDHRLYVTSFRADPADTDKILVFDGKSGKCLDTIDLQVGSVDIEGRHFAQALMFGPNKRLFVPISSTGEVRRYNVESNKFDVFVRRPGGNLGGPLLAPFYLSFGQTDPSTLEYEDD